MGPLHFHFHLLSMDETTVEALFCIPHGYIPRADEREPVALQSAVQCPYVSCHRHQAPPEVKLWSHLFH